TRATISQKFEDTIGVVGVSTYRRIGVCYPEGVRELSPGWRLCGTLGQVFLCDLPHGGNRFNARVLHRTLIEIGNARSIAPSGRTTLNDVNPGFRKASTLG
ncbi:MAG: hypothetical protein WB696_16065, partial [Chthoniobacterales bacterium]